MLWENLRCEQFKDAIETAKGVCVVPIGCLEKHGPHSPLGTDTIISGDACAHAAQLEPVVVFPTMYFGEKSGAGEFPGTVIFSIETRWHIFRETCNEIYRNGFKKILFVNGHGGNKSMLDLFTRAMMEENPNVMVYYTSCGGLGTAAVLEKLLQNPEANPELTPEDRASMQDYIDQKKHGGHACFSETARVMYFRPDTLRMEGVADESGDSIHRFDAFKDSGITTHFSWMGNYPNSYSASNDYVLNERIAKAFTEFYINELAKKFHFLKNETISDEYHAEWLAKRK